jgi:SulP family sulfate permease
LSQASSFTPLSTLEPATSSGWRASLTGALDGAAFVVPLSLGGATLVFSKIGGGVLAGAVFTTLAALALLQLATMRGRRPVVYSARFFEATTLAAMLDRAIELLPSWGMHDTPGARLAVLLLVMGFAGLFAGLLYAARADRLTRHIPSPVFAGFSNGIAFTLLASQAKALVVLLGSSTPLDAILPAAVALGSGAVLRHWMPRWPAAACGLALGLLAGQLLALLGHSVRMLGTASTALLPPVFMADFGALTASGVHQAALATWVASNAAILGAMVFLNTSITAQALSHVDDRPREGARGLAITCGCMAAAGVLGSAPLSGSLQASTAAARKSDLAPRTLLLTALVVMGVACSGLLTIIPVAAVVGSLACEALYMVDRGSVRSLRNWIAGHAVGRHAREDLALVAAVTATAIVFNMVVAVFAGLLLGLLLFASRHITPPVRAVWDGTQLSSNCARSRADLQALAEHGRGLRVVELGGDLFFGTQEHMDRSLRKALQQAECLVLDWSGVRFIDTSASHAIGKFTRAAKTAGVSLVHVDPARGGHDVARALAFLDADDVTPDLDRALEKAENHLLERHRPADADDGGDAMTLFAGLDERERATLEARMVVRRFVAGEMIVKAGDPGDELMVIMQGSASVMVARDDGQLWRVAGMRRGGIIGEMAFLDRSPRSATVAANDDVVIAALDHREFEAMQREEPAIAQKLLANIALYLASRLRRTTRLATARQTRSGT